MNSVLAIASITLKEGLRHRLLYGVLIFAILTMTFSLLFSGLFMRDVLKVILDFCLSAVNIGGLLIPFFLAINLLSGDIEKKTIFAILAKPVSRTHYILGKYAGLIVLVGVIMFCLLGATFLTVACSQLLYADFFFTSLSYTSIILSTFSSYLGISVLTALVVLWSSVSTSSFLVTLLTIATYLVGHTVDEVVRFISIEVPGVELSTTVQSAVRFIRYLFPNLAAFDLKLQAAYGNAIPVTDIAVLFAYATVYIVATISLSTFIFSKRDLA